MTYQLGKAGQHPSLKKLFFEALGEAHLRTSEVTNEPVLDALTLEHYTSSHNRLTAEFARTILDFRKASKIRSTYLEGLSRDADNRIHPTFKIHGTITGRWSSAGPNFQNWPKKMRDLVIPRRPGTSIIQADYSQLELRIIALLAKDHSLLQWYGEGADVHTKTAAGIFHAGDESKVTKAQRNMAKTVEYGFNYNLSSDVTTVWNTLQLSNPDITQRQVQYMRKQWFLAHPAIRQWQLEQVKKAEETGYVEEPLSGRRELFHDFALDPNKILNFPVQGFAGTLMNRAVLALAREIDWKDNFIISQVHDAIYLEGPDVEFLSDMLRRHMHQSITFGGNTMEFPIDVEAGPNMLGE